MTPKVPAGLVVAIVALIPFALSGCSAGSQAEVKVGDDYFEPEDQHISVDSKLLFKVEDGAQHAHTVTIHKAGDPLTTLQLNETVSAGEDVDFKFEEGGTYHVWCMFHGTMTGGMHMLVTVD